MEKFASLHVNDLLSTPLGGPLEIRSTIKEMKGCKVIVESRLIAGGKVCATGEIVAVPVPEQLTPKNIKEKNLPDLLHNNLI